MGARGRRRRERDRQAAALAAWELLTRACPDCGEVRRVVFGPEDLTTDDQRAAYVEVVQAMGQPEVMYVCDPCERVGFMGMWE